MKLWGGVECTVNRVGDRFRDQMRLSGHHDRPEDLARVAELGISTIRFPVLWERVAPDRPDRKDWAWSDERLAECTRLGLRPIIGLLHHGSGPRYTSLVDPEMPGLFEAYAAAAAERYAHVEDWTPVNEPLTTARFSTLYGAWYPHARDTRTFWAALLNQIDATRLAMRAIRRVVPAARLIQTEDLGHCWSTPELGYVADYYNARRWLTWDLLSGTMNESHPLWGEGERLGFGDRLRAIGDDPCPPDVIGINHYPTSDRFLDHHAEPYGPFPDSGFHDVEALRVLDGAPTGLANVLRQAWQRYDYPLAVTECHLGCTREEQMRWLWQSWRTCEALARDGVDVRALTIWALFGGVDWNSLLTVDAGHYEPGVFDVRSDGPPRETALAGIVRAICGAEGDPHRETMARMAGWWERPARFTFPPVAHVERAPELLQDDAAMPPILITGADGVIGQAFAGACRLRGLTHLVTDHPTLPIEDAARVAAVLDLYRPWAVINAAGWSDIDGAEVNESACRAAIADGAGVIARACEARGIHCTILSSDQVLDGPGHELLLEGERAIPIGALGRAQLLAERAALDAGALLVRMGPCFAPYDERNPAVAWERVLREGKRAAASDEHVMTPTYLPDLVSVVLDLIVDAERGLWHLTSGEAMTWLALARRVAGALGFDTERVIAASPEALGWRAPRPRYAALGSTRGSLLPSLDHALSRHAATRRTMWLARYARVDETVSVALPTS